MEGGEEFGCNTCNHAFCDCAALLIVLKEVGYVTGFDDGFEERESVFLRDERGAADCQVKVGAFESDGETFEPDTVALSMPVHLLLHHLMGLYLACLRVNQTVNATKYLHSLHPVAGAACRFARTRPVRLC